MEPDSNTSFGSGCFTTKEYVDISNRILLKLISAFLKQFEASHLFELRLHILCNSGRSILHYLAITNHLLHHV